MKTILVPIDFSRVTDPVLAEATRLARAIDARLILLHVTEPALGLVDYAAVAISIAHVSEAALKTAGVRLAALREALAARAMTVETKVVAGLPAEEILAQASACAADYIVIGSHGHGAIYDVLVGSTTSGVLKRSTCPVLVVPATVPLREAATAPAHQAVQE